MKRGMILYVTEGREKLPAWPDLESHRLSLGMDEVCVATSESDINDQWWRLLTRGVQHIACVRADYDPVREAYEICGAPLRLYG